MYIYIPTIFPFYPTSFAAPPEVFTHSVGHSNASQSHKETIMGHSPYMLFGLGLRADFHIVMELAKFQ
jgi:hypothetical protein